jgi:adenosylhomocysteine nucleosidase
MNILITYAVEAEFAPWRRLRNLEKVTVSGVELHRAQVGRATVDFVITGMGAANAEHASEATISKEYSFCIASGFAGALKSSVKPGDVVAPEKVQPSGTGKAVICARNLVRSAKRDGALRIATLLTADHVVRTAEEKATLSPFAEAVDMESYSILSVARAKKLPAMAIRVISDSFNRDLPVQIDTMVDQEGRVRISGVVRYVARHPLMLPALVRLGRDSRTAAEALAHFLEAYIKKLSFATHGWPPPELQEVAAS